MVEVHVEHGEERERVAFDAICFDGRAYGWLRENKLCQLIHV
jgi:hypothetical protein